MLIDPDLTQSAGMAEFIAVAAGRETGHKRLSTGVYEIGHFNFEHYLPVEYEQYPELPNIGCYGVCDFWQQITKKEPELMSNSRSFVISVTAIAKANEPEDGGWRWHKWGEYIGEQKPQCEYIHDEPVIERVYCYHIYEIL